MVVFAVQKTDSARKLAFEAENALREYMTRYSKVKNMRWEEKQFD